VKNESKRPVRLRDEGGFTSATLRSTTGDPALASAACKDHLVKPLVSLKRLDSGGSIIEGHGPFGTVQKI